MDLSIGNYIIDDIKFITNTLPVRLVKKLILKILLILIDSILLLKLIWKLKDKKNRIKLVNKIRPEIELTINNFFV